MTKTDKVAYIRSWREKNRKAQREYYARYRKENKSKLNAHQKAYRERNKNSPEFKLRKNLRERLRNAIKGTRKSKPTMLLVGCTIDELKAHLEKQFRDGMDWSNYGQWHIDHIKPCTAFDLLTPEAQLECFHYSNLQPLWASENMSKGAKYP